MVGPAEYVFEGELLLKAEWTGSGER